MLRSPLKDCRDKKSIKTHAKIIRSLSISSPTNNEFTRRDGGRRGTRIRWLYCKLFSSPKRFSLVPTRRRLPQIQLFMWVASRLHGHDIFPYGKHEMFEFRCIFKTTVFNHLLRGYLKSDAIITRV